LKLLSLEKFAGLSCRGNSEAGDIDELKKKKTRSG
jgi:hypothetical protein